MVKNYNNCDVQNLEKNLSSRWNLNLQPSVIQMEFEPMTLCDLVGHSNHWATGDSMLSKGVMWVLDWNSNAWLRS